VKEPDPPAPAEEPALPAPAADGQASGPAITAAGHVSPANSAEVLALAEAAAAADGVLPLSEATLLHLKYGGGRAALDLLLRTGARLAGFAHLDPAGPGGERGGELAVHPTCRRRGFGRALAQAVLAGAAGAPVRLWAHGDLPAAARLAQVCGFRRDRELWRMLRPSTVPLAAPVLPSGVRLRTFVPGQDEAGWLKVNARAFASHPEQGSWTRQDLERRERERWFDPAGFFIAERNGRLAGFHWTKVHPGGPSGDGPVGEVYVVGVDPAEQGTGLGRALTLAGLRYLRDRGVPAVMLYVDGANTPAIKMYKSLGFSHVSTDVMYGHEGNQAIE
jgi:mycothiol synthase